MDRRTELLIDALAHPAAVFVFHLLQAGPLREDDLISRVPDTSQATANRRLQKLGDLGLLIREPGPKQYKNRPWAIVAPDAAATFIESAINLARAIDRVDEGQRQLAEGELQAARKVRRLKAI